MTTQTEQRSATDTTCCRWCGEEWVEYVNGETGPACQCESRYQERVALLRTDLTPRMRMAKQDQIPSEMRRGLTAAGGSFPEDRKTGRGIWIAGPVGTGKTMALAVYGQRVVQVHLAEVRYVNIVNLLRTMREHIQDYDAVLGRYLRCDLLLLDDIGKEMLSEGRRETLYYLVDQRYSNLLPTWYATNLTGKELVERCGEAIADRIIETSRVLKMTGQSLRKSPGRML